MARQMSLGHNIVIRGWSLKLKLGGSKTPVIEVNDRKGFSEEATLYADGHVHYKNAERVPREVRAEVKKMFRRILREGLGQ